MDYTKILESYYKDNEELEQNPNVSSSDRDI